MPLAAPAPLQSLQKVKAAFVPEESGRPGGWGSVRVAPSWEWVVRVPTAPSTRLERKPRPEMLPGDMALEGWGSRATASGAWAGRERIKDGAGHLPAWCQPTFSLPVHRPTGHQLAHCPQ